MKGFSQPLASLPLIQNQVDRQIKLIQSGKVSDTGLYAGDDASPNQVEVLDINTISHSQPAPPPPPPPVVIPPTPPPVVTTLADAEAADATIDQSSLTDASIPTPPNHVFTSPSFPLTGNSFFGSQKFAGFVARNIFVIPHVPVLPSIIGTKDENLTALQVDLSPYASLASFDLVAVNNFSIAGSVTFMGLSPSADLALIAGNQFILSPGTSVRADAHDFLLSSPSTLTLDNVSLVNMANNLSLNSGQDVSFLNGAQAYAQAKLSVSAANNISASGAQFTADTALFTSLTGTVEFDNTTLNAASHAIFGAPTAINLNNSTINSDYVVLNGASSAAITLNNTTINAPSSLTALSSGDLNINGSSLNADAASGTIYLGSTTGATSISGTSITANNLTVSAATSINFDGGLPATPEARRGGPAHYLTLNSGDGILLNARGHALNAGGENPTATFTAGLASGNSINVNNTDFSPFAVVNMAANTVNLANVAFGDRSVVTLRSLNGVLAPNPNTGAASVPGDVNFIYSVTYARIRPNTTSTMAPASRSPL